jgi:APA family basic amino acid/polyamine antiporter
MSPNRPPATSLNHSDGAAPPTREPESLIRAIGTFGLAAAEINITVGGGVFRLPANAAARLGAAAPLAYLICAVAMGLIVRCIADAGSRVPLTGGPYAFIGVALGPYAGFLSGILLLMIGLFAGSALGSVFAASVGGLVPMLASRAGEAFVLGAALLWWSVINMRGVALGTRLNSAAMIVKLIPLLLIGVGGLYFVRGTNFYVTSWPAVADVARASLVLAFIFGGVEVALVPSGEVRNPARTVPRAIMIAMVAITALYIAVQVSAQGILGGGLAQASVSPLADAAGLAFGRWAHTVLLAGAIVSIFGVLGGMTLSLPRLVFALARDGYFPRGFAVVHPRYRTPHRAIFVLSLAVLALALSGTFERLAILANISALLLYLGCVVAAWRLRAGGGKTLSARMRLGGLVPWLAGLVIAALLTGTRREEWLGISVCLLLATLMYAGVCARQRTGVRALDAP